jgi:hypothetical protein
MTAVARTRRCAVCRAGVSEGIVCTSCLAQRSARNGKPAAPRTVEELPLESLSVPREYQREERPHLVRRIIREFDPDLVGLLTVVRDRDGQQWLLDGQHRWLALVALGHDSALCEVLHAVPLPRQAEIFSERNGRRLPPHPRDTFRSDYAGRHPDVLAIAAVLLRYGYRLPLGSEKGAADCFVCVSTLREVHAWGLLEPTVGLIHDAWPEDAMATQASIVGGLAACLRLYPTVDRADLRRRLVRHSPDEILRRARVRLANDLDRRLWAHAAHVMVDLYNRGRMARYRLDPPVIPYDAARRWKTPNG